MTLRTEFGRRLRQLRRYADLTQEALAERLDVSPEFVSGVERGLYAPSFDTLEGLCAVLGVPVQELFAFETLPPAAPDVPAPSAPPGPGLFVFTAASPRAQANLARSVHTPVALNLVEPALDPATRRRLAEASPGAVYAWGVAPSKNGSREAVWAGMHPGDYVLGVWQSAYHLAARVVATTRNRTVAETLWGREGEVTWEYIYFLTRPHAMTRPLVALEPWLWRAYRGFSRIGVPALVQIAAAYGSVSIFMAREFGLESQGE